MPVATKAPASGPILLLDAAGDRLQVGLASASGEVLRMRRSAPITGRDRALALARMASAALAAAGGRATGVAAVVGPATPGGVRLAVTVANALGWALGVPVAAYGTGERATVAFGRWLRAGNLRPVYLHAPNITTPK